MNQKPANTYSLIWYWTHSVSLFIPAGTSWSLLAPRWRKVSRERERRGDGNCLNSFPLKLSSSNWSKEPISCGKDLILLHLRRRTLSEAMLHTSSGNSVNSFRLKSIFLKFSDNESWGRLGEEREFLDKSRSVTFSFSILSPSPSGREWSPCFDKLSSRQLFFASGLML